MKKDFLANVKPRDMRVPFTIGHLSDTLLAALQHPDFHAIAEKGADKWHQHHTKILNKDNAAT